MNHQLAYGAYIADGLVGVAAGLLLSEDLADAAYAASWDSGDPTVGVSSLAGFICGIKIVTTVPMFAGIGGRGETLACTSVLIALGLIWLGI